MSHHTRQLARQVARLKPVLPSGHTYEQRYGVSPANDMLAGFERLSAHFTPEVVARIDDALAREGHVVLDDIPLARRLWHRAVDWVAKALPHHHVLEVRGEVRERPVHLTLITRSGMMEADGMRLIDAHTPGAGSLIPSTRGPF